MRRRWKRPAQLVDTQISLRPGGKAAFPAALLAEWVERRREATSFIERHTTGWPSVVQALRPLDVGSLLDDAGVTHAAFQMVLSRLLKSRNWVSVLGSDFCPPPHGTAATQALLNLHLASGNIGRRGTGLP